MVQFNAKAIFVLLAGMALLCLLVVPAIGAPDTNSAEWSDVSVAGKSVDLAKVEPVKNKESELKADITSSVVLCEIGKVQAPTELNLLEVSPGGSGTETWQNFASGDCDHFVGYDARAERHQR